MVLEHVNHSLSNERNVLQYNKLINVFALSMIRPGVKYVMDCNT